MKDINNNDDINRRQFFDLSKKYGLTAVLVAGGGAGLLVSEAAVAASASEERKRKRAAKYTMVVATAYVLGASRSYPIMQLDFKENVQNMTNGQVYVKLAPGKQLGAGGALVQKVQQGTIQAAQHSLSNFAPFAPAIDLINLPYFCGANQKFINLVNSNAWREDVHPRVEAKGFKVLWYVVIDPRVVALRKGGRGPIKTPRDLAGLKFRVPGSKMLQQYYRSLGANPTPVAWGETPSAIKQGVADALDPAVGALNVFGFKDILSWVTFTRAVPDSQVFSCNLAWFDSLPKDVQQGIEMASELTSHQNLAKVPAARAYAMSQMREAGVQFYTPTSNELAQWVAKGGHQNKAWDSYKVKLAGSIYKFSRLLEAANTKGRYYVHDA